MLNTADMPTVRSEDIRALKSSSPLFRGWAKEAWIRGYLDTVVETLIITGVVTNVCEALAYLETIHTERLDGAGGVALVDFMGKNPWNRLHTRLRIALGKTTPGEQDLTLMHGVIGHAALPRLFVSRLFRERNHRVQREESRESFLPFPSEGEPDGQLTFGFGDNTSVIQGVIEQLRSGGSIFARTALKRAMVFWKEHQHLVESGDRGRWRALVPKLRLIMEPLFGEYVARLNLHPAAKPETTFLTLMTWASALYYWKENPHRTLFSEINTLLPTHGFSGGRVDAVELYKVDGERLSRKQGRFIEHLRSLNHRSVGELLRRFERVLPGILDIGILDWKFAVGDAVVRGEIIKPSQVLREPFAKHRHQVERYLALVILDHTLQRGIRDNDEIWARYKHRLTADIVYLLPGALPVVHKVTPDPSLLEDVFTTSTVLSWDNARDRSKVRKVNNAILGHLMGLIEGKQKETRKNGTNGTSQHPQQVEIFDGAVGLATAKDIIEKHRHRNGKTSVDPFGILSKTPGGYEMHFDRLVSAIEHGNVVTRNFSPERGGKVSCVIPGHDDSGPSMHIYLTGTPRFFCFGCEARGVISIRSLPENFEFLSEMLRGTSVLTKKQSLGMEGVIPERHHQMFSTLQGSFARAFRHSPAEHYVAQRRHIDPDFAHTHGVGFGTLEALDDLFDAGYTLDELTTSGVLGFSPRIHAESRVPKFLRRHGVHLSEMTRTMGGKLALPYCLLIGRVTFPLTFEGRFSNFYGRSVSMGGVPHVKLSTHLTQGGFNMAALSDPSSSEVIMTEGAFDALTLMSLGFANVFSLIGVLNIQLFGSIMRSGKDLAIGFDRDANLHKTGQTKTLKIESELRGWGFPGCVRDYTEAFIQDLPPGERPNEGIGKKWDFNGWWCDRASHR